MTRRHTALLASVLFVLAACQGEQTTSTTTSPTTTTAATTTQAADKKVVLYSGRNEKLIKPLLDRFTLETGIAVETRFGESAELAATLMEEGARTPADVFFSQDAAGLAAIAKAGLARQLPQDVVGKVPARFAAADGKWIGISGRARTVVYDPKKIKPEQLPQSLEQVGEPRYRGRFGVAPLNASLQSHLAAYSALQGEEALDKLLAALVAHEPKRYAKNSAVVEAVAAGEIDWGLVNHYYLWESKKAKPDASLANFIMPGGDVSSFVNVAGVAIVDDDPDAVTLVQYLLSEPAQRYFAEQTFEYPLVAGVPASVALQPLGEVRTPDLDFTRIADALPRTLTKISESGLSRQ